MVIVQNHIIGDIMDEEKDPTKTHITLEVQDSFIGITTEFSGE